MPRSTMSVLSSLFILTFIVPGTLGQSTHCKTPGKVDEGDVAWVKCFLSDDSKAKIRVDVCQTRGKDLDDRADHCQGELIFEGSWNSASNDFVIKDIKPGFEYAGISGNKLTLLINSANKNHSGRYYCEDANTYESSQWETCSLCVKGLSGTTTGGCGYMKRCNTSETVEEGKTAVLKFFMSKAPFKGGLDFVNISKTHGNSRAQVFHGSWDKKKNKMTVDHIESGYDFVGVVDSKLTLIIHEAHKSHAGEYLYVDSETEQEPEQQTCTLNVTDKTSGTGKNNTQPCASQQPDSSSGNDVGIAVGVTLAVLGLAAAVVGAFCYFRKRGTGRCKPKKEMDEAKEMDEDKNLKDRIPPANREGQDCEMVTNVRYEGNPADQSYQSARLLEASEPVQVSEDI